VQVGQWKLLSAGSGGSVRDVESIAACAELGLAMVVTGRRHFLH